MNVRLEIRRLTPPLRVLVCSILASAALWAPVAGAGAEGLQVRQGGTLKLEGNSTLHAYHAKATQLRVTIKADPAKWSDVTASAVGGDAVERLVRDGGVTTLEVVVGVTGLQSGKNGLDKNMHKALKAEAHPEIRFVLSGYDVGKAAGDSMTIAMRGKLSIAGVDRTIEIAAKARREGETLRITADVPLLMSQYGIKPPVMMMGTVKTADAVVVKFDLAIGVAEPEDAKKS